MISCEVAIIGAGAAGLFAAARVGQAGRSVILIEHAQTLGEKIRISGGGRCNFTNINTAPENFLGENPDFCRSALARYTPRDFIALLARHRIAWHEKHKGQLFCDGSAKDIITMLRAECERGGVDLWQPCAVATVSQSKDGFVLETSRGSISARSLVIATGGLSIPKIGASDFGLRIARQFGHRVIEPRPALVPLTFDAASWAPFVELAGVALEVGVSTLPPRPERGRRGAAAVSFTEDLLFTHRGLSGPAILQVSSYWRPGEALSLDLVPNADPGEVLAEAKAAGVRHLGNELARHLPARLAQTWLKTAGVDGTRALTEWRTVELRELGAQLKNWVLRPTGSEGWRKAEVMAGGVETRELNSQSMQSERIPDLYFIGEVVDVTGWLGGYNFQWAWASAAACAGALSAR
jgi:predicted Rossmann fold flavoprotein